jgi:hypothetical protein
LYTLAENRLKGWKFLEKLNDYQIFKNHFVVCGCALAEKLRYRPEGHKLDSRWGHFFSRTMALGST